MIKKDDIEMTTVTQEEIEARVMRNSNRFKNTIKQVTSEIRSQKLQRGRVRQRNPAESAILNKFKKK